MSWDNGGESVLDNGTANIKKFGGTIHYVAKTGDDDNSGIDPTEPLLTIGAAITASSTGDAISVREGMYTETGLDLDTNGVEIWFEIGAILAPSTGVPLTISGSYCWVGCHNGALRVTNSNAAVTGVLITGNWVYLSEIRVSCGSVGTIGYDVQGLGCDLRRCRCADPVTAAYKVQGDTAKLEDCCSGGLATNGSIGYWITNSCDKFRITDCGSQGHSTAAFQVDAGCTNGVIWNFTSGGGDGKWTDADDTTVISDLTYPETKYATQTFAGGGGGSTNLFKVLGTVKVVRIYGHVVTALSADVDNLNLEFDDGTASVDITTGVDVSSAPVGSFLLKNDEATEPLVYASSANAAIVEAPTGFKSQQVISPFILVSKSGATNYITADYSGVATSGAIHWHIEWVPQTEAGFVEPA